MKVKTVTRAIKEARIAATRGERPYIAAVPPEEAGKPIPIEEARAIGYPRLSAPCSVGWVSDGDPAADVGSATRPLIGLIEIVGDRLANCVPNDLSNMVERLAAWRDGWDTLGRMRALEKVGMIYLAPRDVTYHLSPRSELCAWDGSPLMAGDDRPLVAAFDSGGPLCYSVALDSGEGDSAARAMLRIAYDDRGPIVSGPMASNPRAADAPIASMAPCVVTAILAGTGDKARLTSAWEARRACGHLALLATMGHLFPQTP